MVRNEKAERWFDGADKGFEMGWGRYAGVPAVCTFLVLGTWFFEK